MSITITAIIEAVNEAIKTTESSGALSARMRISLNQALRWLSKQKKWSFLHKKDATQTLASADQALDYPSDFRVEDKITLNDGTYEGPPLKLLDGGFDAWLSHREDETTAQYDEPQYYVKRGEKFYLDPIADADYTASIWYWANHAKISEVGDSITFPDEFETAVVQATIAAYLDNTERHQKAQYYWNMAANEVAELEDFVDFEPSFVKYHDI